MSEENQENQKKHDPKVDKVIMEIKDIEIIKKFYEQFNLTLDDTLKDAMSTFEASQTLRTQDDLRIAITDSMITLKESFKEIDEIFVEMIDSFCTQTSYELKFQRELENTLSGEE